MGKWTRRAFIGTGTLAGGGLLLGVAGVTFAPNRLTVVGDADEPGQINTWITVTPDNIVTVLVPHCEMGQGALTALAMMAAEEMEADWGLVRIKEAPALDAYANAYMLRAFTGDSIPAPFERAVDYGSYRLVRWFGLQATGGSTSVRGTGRYGMSVAGAAAKEMLIEAAADRFGVNASECSASKSRVVHAASGRSATFGELAAAAAEKRVPAHPALKDPDTYTLRRTPKPRADIPLKVDGRAKYGMDFTIDGMLYAAIEIAPVFGGKLVSVDPGPALAMPGVRQVVQLEEAVAVVADSYWRARQGMAALAPSFDDGGNSGVSSETIFAAFDAALGAPPEVPADGHTVVTADYRVPFLAHAAMEPLSCTARVSGDRAEVWAGTQDPLNARATAAEALGFAAAQVHVTNLWLGGGFGRRLPFNLDFVGLGARVAQAMSPVPVKTVWSRENDTQHDYYRPAAMTRFAGALNAERVPVAIASWYAGGGDGESSRMPYAIADKRFEARDAAHPVRTGPWRSVLNSQHGFFKESFIDEMAHAAGEDPYQFRLRLLDEEPRFRAVLERAATMAGWGTPLPAGEGRGIAICESFGSIVGEVAHVAVSPDGKLRVLDVFAAVDCGDVVNPDGAAAQAEGGIIFGLSAAMVGEITIEAGRVAQSNFHDHEMIHLSDAPRVHVEFVRSGARLGGLGEPCVPPIAAAVTNAIFAASGVRVRSLPIKNQELARSAQIAPPVLMSAPAAGST